MCSANISWSFGKNLYNLTLFSLMFFFQITIKNHINWNKEKPVVSIILSALFYGWPNGPYSRSEEDKIFVVPVSDHSSWSELNEMIKNLQPCKIYPIVLHKKKKGFWNSRNPPNLKIRNDMTVFDKFLNKSRKNECAIPCSVLRNLENYVHPIIMKKSGKVVSRQRRKRKNRGVNFDDTDEEEENENKKTKVSLAENKLEVGGFNFDKYHIGKTDENLAEILSVEDNGILISDICKTRLIKNTIGISPIRDNNCLNSTPPKTRLIKNMIEISSIKDNECSSSTASVNRKSIGKTYSFKDNVKKLGVLIDKVLNDVNSNRFDITALRNDIDSIIEIEKYM